MTTVDAIVNYSFFGQRHQIVNKTSAKLETDKQYKYDVSTL